MATSSAKQLVSESRFRVRYAESDQMGYAHHSVYVVWIEQGRTDWLLAQGVSYASLEKEKIFLPVATIKIRYQRPARFEDEICVRTWLTDAGVCRVRFANEILRVEGSGPATTIAKGEVDLATVGEAGTPIRLPKDLQSLLRARVHNPSLEEKIRGNAGTREAHT